MANRRDFFFRQRVTEAELDEGFAELETAIRAMSNDLGLVGVAFGLAVAQAGVPNLTVVVSGPGAALDQTGQRIAIPSSQTVNVAVDEGALSTAVAVPGNTKILSIFAEFDRALSDPRLDGNSVTVNFVRSESFQINVVQGAEGVTPTAPPLRSDQILLADVTLAFGQTAVVNANVSTTRREWMFKTTSGTAVGAGTVEEAIQTLATAISTDASGLSAHLADAVDAHDATSISNAPAGSVAATTVQAAINELDVEKLALAGGTMTGNIFMDAATEITMSRQRIVAIPLIAFMNAGSGWAIDETLYGEWVTNGAIFDQKIFFDVLSYLPDGATFEQLQVVWEQSASFAGVTDQAAARLRRHQLNMTTGAETTSTPTTSAYGSGTGVKVTAVNPANFVIDKKSATIADSSLLLEVESAVGGTTRVKGIILTFIDPGPRNI